MERMRILVLKKHLSGNKMMRKNTSILSKSMSLSGQGRSSFMFKCYSFLIKHFKISFIGILFTLYKVFNVFLKDVHCHTEKFLYIIEGSEQFIHNSG